jgi:hypothetical protein
MPRWEKNLLWFLGMMTLAVAIPMVIKGCSGDGRADRPVQYLSNVGPEGTMFVDCSYSREEITAAVDAQLKELGK